MKYLTILSVLVSMTGCEAMKCAKQDYKNFRRTIVYNAKQKAVYKNATFTPTYCPPNGWRYVGLR